MRRKVVAGNWKMNLTPSQAKALVDEFRPHIDNPEDDVILCVPAILYQYLKSLRGQAFILVQRICIMKKRVHIQESSQQRC